jgi:phosphatidylserine/phosphatidylglycerophosphate/cardiolipin synthase-like enzyme
MTRLSEVTPWARNFAAAASSATKFLAAASTSAAGTLTRFGPDATWPNSKSIGVHAKFWMVDEHAFYIGSENLNPSELQEFGYIVEDHASAMQVLHDYWDKIWRWSAPAQISGGGLKTCVFTRSAKK